MKTLLIIVIAIVLTIWFAVDFVWCRSLTEREAKLKKDYESYRKDVYAINKRQLELEQKENFLNGFKIGLETRERELDKRVEALHDQKQELDGKADYYALMEKAYKELKAEKEAKKAKKK